jgi:flagellar hook assembly protein FlgD
LVNNYPNPFTHATTIEYTLPENGRVMLRVVNAMGKVVALLVDGNRSAGKHIVQWKGHTGQGGLLSQGIYLCELVFGKNRIIRKMNLLD